jgi:hypothetical protein
LIVFGISHYLIKETFGALTSKHFFKLRPVVLLEMALLLFVGFLNELIFLCFPVSDLVDMRGNTELVLLWNVLYFERINRSSL